MGKNSHLLGHRASPVGTVQAPSPTEKGWPRDGQKGSCTHDHGLNICMTPDQRAHIPYFLLLYSLLSLGGLKLSLQYM